MSQDRWHPTIEQLSASLDGQLPTSEQGQLDTHLGTCESCQLTLADLRQTMRLLHALPRPGIPRSFLLTAEAITTPQEHVNDHPVRLLPTTQRRTRPKYTQTLLRTFSTLAAVLGIVLLLSGLLPSFASQPSMDRASSTASQQQKTSGAGQAQNTPTLPHTATRFAIKQTPKVEQTPVVVRPKEEPASSPPLFDIRTLLGRVLWGTVLLLLGIGGWIAIRFQKS